MTTDTINVDGRQLYLQLKECRMKPGRDAELVPGPFIDIWIVSIIVSDVDGSIFTLVFLVVTIIENCTYKFNNSR